MKQYLAVEKLKDDDGRTGWFKLVFCAQDDWSAQEWVDNYRELFGVKVKYCGELTS